MHLLPVATPAPQPAASRADRKERGAYFTPRAIADFLATWAVGDNKGARVLDPTCGEAVFLEAASEVLTGLGADRDGMDGLLFGIDVHPPSIRHARRTLRAGGLDATLLERDFFATPVPGEPDAPLPRFDAVVGNPPFIRYQRHAGEQRARAARAALAQGVRLSGLASSWAALLVHACAFLKPEGRLAMVLPAELLSVHYAEPVRRWLRRRFADVHLVMFERLQFEDALENVILLLAQGGGGCDAFSLYHVRDATELASIKPFENVNAAPAAEGKWTDILLPRSQRQMFRDVIGEHFTTLGDYGSPELGTVTGANRYFAIAEDTRREYGIPDRDVVRISPPGTKHLRGPSFTGRDWNRLRDDGEAVWLLHPEAGEPGEALQEYIEYGEGMGVDLAYKCRIREPWWRPPLTAVPDLFFTYMSHRFPRLIENRAHVRHLNSMHGLRLREGTPKCAKAVLPLLALNSVTMLGAELFGRSYGGGVLKMEPREAATLPVPGFEEVEAASAILKDQRGKIVRQLRQGLWTNAVKQIDDTLLRRTMGLTGSETAELHEAARSLRQRRVGAD